ncbi:hypothetical protein SS1G_07260 [Sclerotinia sclerotiorum 1980 UF-70]|uniref:DUF6594 domain-containing protein n=2 Tax=Sclerotinia sclerotiorum (strain ATCC 18683 / 1980 / Ss-1) TaxID=665079 RepID=A7EPL1_SCLS1|nr:hypothetical protein SS1G_07260 [Sclerotinia sclerotiorum 1980 UF-70]APA10290.1 hypothetical protein sscle_06g050600 [Sclerotinia sclerotiorum 1980 UF-70]EDO04777.1 hypothetical protein SS1G_07260 [Sclerotinia sclerotiorum 1980 UF-70]
MAKKLRKIATTGALQPVELVSPTATSQSDETVVGSPISQLQFTSGPWEKATDPSKDLEKPLPGWPLVSKLIADYPDLEAFKAFRALNIKSLLYYQAELENLRMKLHQAEYNEHRQGEAEGIKSASMMSENLGYYLFHARMDDDKCKSQQVKIMEQIRVVLKEYNAALLQYSQITALPRADPYNVETLRVWIKRDGNHCISGPAAKAWGDYTESVRKEKPLKWQFISLLRSMFWPAAPQPDILDLVVPRQGHKVDSLTRWVANEFVPFWHSLKQTLRRKKVKTSSAENGLPTTETKAHSSLGSGKSQRSLFSWLSRRNNSTGTIQADSKSKNRAGLTVYSEARMLRFTSSVATVIACLLPTVAIAVLSSLQSTAELLGVIAAFTAIFAMGLMFLTDSGTSRVEIFTATAAFSAVMVVFVQNQNVYVGSYGNSPGTRIMNSTNTRKG